MSSSRQSLGMLFVFLAIACASTSISCASLTLNVVGGTVEKITGDSVPNIFLFGNTSDGKPFSFSAGVSSLSGIPQAEVPYSSGGSLGVTFNSRSGDFAIFALTIDGTDVSLQPSSRRGGLKITGPLSATVPIAAGMTYAPVVFDPYTELDAPGNSAANPPTYVISGIGLGVAEFVFTSSIAPSKLDLSRYTYSLGSSVSNLSTPEASAFVIWSLVGMTACILTSSRFR